VRPYCAASASFRPLGGSASIWPNWRPYSNRGPALTASGRAGRLTTSCGATTPATQAAAMPLPLTDREREIAILISQGLSNIEIAEALTLSVRTIEGHIYRACARVGTATRTELAQLITEFAPTHGSSLH
jgi:DNA-binding NarL/FixJ family response regulator